MTDTDTEYITSASRAVRDARAFATIYVEDTADEMRVLSAWFGYWGGFITEESRIRAVDGPAEATPWSCETDGHETEPAVTGYPDGIGRCRWCYINDAAIRRAEADIPAMAPAIEGPGPAVLFDCAQSDARTDYRRSPSWETLDAAARDLGPMPDTWAPWPPSFAAVLEPDAAAMAAGPWPMWVDGEMRPIPCQQADVVGSGFVFDWKTTPPMSWTDMPPISRRMRFWYAATDPILAFGRWMVRPLVSPLFLVAVVVVETVLRWIFRQP